MDLAMTGKKAIVTGASRGVGVHIARALAAGGADLLLVARSEPELVRLAKELRTPEIEVADRKISDARSGWLFVLTFAVPFFATVL